MPGGRPRNLNPHCDKHSCSKDAKNSRGYAICIFCQRETGKKSYQLNPDKTKARIKIANERRKPYQKQRYLQNKVFLLEQNKKWINANKQHHNDLKQKWRTNNPEKMREYCNNYRALKKNASGKHTAEQWLELCFKQNYICKICGLKKKLERDHIVPLSKNGSNGIENIQALCRSCNASKRDKLVEQEIKNV